MGLHALHGIGRQDLKARRLAGSTTSLTSGGGERGAGIIAGDWLAVETSDRFDRRMLMVPFHDA